VFVHSHFIENSPIDLEEINPSFLRWFCHSCATPNLAPAVAPEEIVVEEDLVEMVPEQEAPKAHEVILEDTEPEPLQPRLFNVLVRDYEESPSKIMDDLDDLDDLTKADYDMDEWFLEDGSND
jgi:hypothetical protein